MCGAQVVGEGRLSVGLELQLRLQRQEEVMYRAGTLPGNLSVAFYLPSPGAEYLNTSDLILEMSFIQALT